MTPTKRQILKAKATYYMGLKKFSGHEAYVHAVGAIEREIWYLISTDVCQNCGMQRGNHINGECIPNKKRTGKKFKDADEFRIIAFMAIKRMFNDQT